MASERIPTLCAGPIPGAERFFSGLFLELKPKRDGCQRCARPKKNTKSQPTNSEHFLPIDGIPHQPPLRLRLWILQVATPSASQEKPCLTKT